MAERGHQSAAAAAAEQVKAIVEAAERSAAEVEAAARAEAERIRADTERRTREGVGRVDERVEELNRRLDELSEGVAAAVAALKEELAGLRGAPGTGAAGTEPDEALIAEAEEVAARAPEVEDVEEAAAEPTSAAPEGARVLALKMALDGSPREETARYLRENFELDDPDGLLDEVYARAGR